LKNRASFVDTEEYFPTIKTAKWWKQLKPNGGKWWRQWPYEIWPTSL